MSFTPDAYTKVSGVFLGCVTCGEEDCCFATPLAREAFAREHATGNLFIKYYQLKFD